MRSGTAPSGAGGGTEYDDVDDGATDRETTFTQAWEDIEDTSLEVMCVCAHLVWFVAHLVVVWLYAGSWTTARV